MLERFQCKRETAWEVKMITIGGFTMSVLQKADGNFVVEDDETGHTRRKEKERSQNQEGKMCRWKSLQKEKLLLTSQHRGEKMIRSKKNTHGTWGKRVRPNATLGISQAGNFVTGRFGAPVPSRLNRLALKRLQEHSISP